MALRNGDHIGPENWGPKRCNHPNHLLKHFPKGRLRVIDEVLGCTPPRDRDSISEPSTSGADVTCIFGKGKGGGEIMSALK